YGDALANLLAAIGYRVSREFLVNDYGKQVMGFARSLEARYRQALGHDAEVPADGYRGDYLIEMGKELAASEGMGLIGRLPEIRHWGITHVLASHRATLEKFGVTFDNWFSETYLHTTGKVDAAIARLTELGYTYESEGAIWFKASESGASRDQVLIRSGDPTPTYLAADVAYMLDKLERGFERILYVWGADHHGNSETLMAAARVLGIEDRVEIIIYQLVNFLSKGEPVRMSKRTGDLVTMDELIDEVGVDAARYTLLTRSTDSTIDFDLETVKAESQDNPVYYVQYQYARISSILRYAVERSIALRPAKEVDLGRLTHPSETTLIQKLSEYPELIESSAKLRAPFRITNYMQSLGAAFSAFYRDCRAITDDTELTQARLALASAARQVLSNAFAVLGVSAPERM
ncbi:MAG TPA: arginine--tRNA ligase, partial [Actinomycetota bacterium]|nr:arginine--tRNA ligase [Actinomycetota bacterium]